MFSTPLRDPSRRRGCNDENVVAACNAMKKWLSSPVTPDLIEDAQDAALSPQNDLKSPPQEWKRIPDPVMETSTGSRNSSSVESVQDLHGNRSMPNLSPKQLDDSMSSVKHDVFESKTDADISPTPPMLEKSKTKRGIYSWSVSAKSTVMDNEAKNETHAATNLKACPVGRWLIQVDEPCTTSITDDIVQVYNQAIDTNTGSFLPEVEYPETLLERQTGPCRDYNDMAWRQSNMTSELQIRREILSRERIAAVVRSQLQTDDEVISHKPLEDEQVAWPKADCVLRPVKSGDFQQIADIMNLERATASCPQILESQIIKASDIEKVFSTCRRNMQPFIVATSPEDELLDRSKWPKNADKVYAEYLRYRKAQNATRKETIFGYAFVKDARLGTLETPNPGSRHSCQIKMAVHPDHRRGLYGSALLDRILSSTAPYHKSLLDYVWQCQDPRDVYEAFAGHNRRQYNWIYVESLCVHKDHQDFVWRRSFLERFGFKETALFPKAAKTDRGYESEWLDLSLWALEAQPPSKIIDRAPGNATNS